MVRFQGGNNAGHTIKVDDDDEAYVSCEIKKDKPLILTKEMEVK